MAYVKTNWIDNQTPINATNLNKIENQLENITGTVLWTNPNPNASYSSGVLTISGTFTGINYYEILYKNAGDNKVQSTGKVLSQYGTRLVDLSSGVPNYRDIGFPGTNTINIGPGRFYTSYNTSETRDFNQGCVPIQIIGYK